MGCSLSRAVERFDNAGNVRAAKDDTCNRDRTRREGGARYHCTQTYEWGPQINPPFKRGKKFGVRFRIFSVR